MGGIQNALLDDPDCWNHHPIGFVPAPTLETTAGPSPATDVIVTTDGARLAATNVDDVAGWLAEGIVDVDENWPHPHPFGDLGLIWARHR